MPNRSSSAAVLILAAVAFAQTAAPPVSDEKPASIEGVVTNAVTGEPVPRAHIMMDGFVARKQQQFGAMTTADGKFSITGVPAGNYVVRAERLGFVMPQTGQGGPGITLRPGDAKSDFQLKLAPTGAIHGRVLDHDGNPMEGVSVSAESARSRGPAATSDDKGNYRIGGLAPGRYRVKASLPNAMPVSEIRADGTSEIYYAPTYYPSAPDLKSATRVEVRAAADVTGVDIRLRRAPIIRVSGVITAMPAGAAPGSVRVEARRDDPRSGFYSTANGMVSSEGKFEVWKLEPGKWTLTAVSGSRDGMLRSAPVDVDVADTNIDGLELRFVPAFDISGQVEYEDESARPVAPPSGGPPPSRRIGLRHPYQGVAVALAEDGSFRFTGVQPGRYQVTLGWRASVKSVRLGSTTIEGNVLDLTSGAAGGAMTVVLTGAMCEVSGTVTDEKGSVAGARVAAIQTDGVGTPVSSAVAAADGTYRIQNLPAGKYKVAAVDDNDPAVMQGDFEDYEDVLVTVDLRPGDKLTKDLKRRSAAR